MKRFVPLESNPEVFDELIHSMGVSKSVSWHDVFSIDEPELLAMIPRPVFALVLTFPVSDTYEKYRIEQDRNVGDYQTISGTSEEDAIWFKQTIGNACGTMALLHAMANGLPNEYIEPDSAIDKLVKEAAPLNVQRRVELLENSQDLESHHRAVATKGATEAPPAEAKVEHHYLCLTRAPKSGNLYELDGRRKGPIDHGPLNKDLDLLSEKPLELVKEFLQRESGSASFSILALAPSF
jgi:ubiquitin carboxyl-terminal hydrolase L3